MSEMRIFHTLCSNRRPDAAQHKLKVLSLSKACSVWVFSAPIFYQLFDIISVLQIVSSSHLTTTTYSEMLMFNISSMLFVLFFIACLFSVENSIVTGFTHAYW